MNKETALLIVAKDLFLEVMKLKSATEKTHPKVQKDAAEYVADEFIAFLRRLQVGISGDPKGAS